MFVKKKGQPQFCSRYCLPCFLREGLLLDRAYQIHEKGWLTRLSDPHVCIFPAMRQKHVPPHLAFLYVFWWSNFGLHISVVSSLPWVRHLLIQVPSLLYNNLHTYCWNSKYDKWSENHFWSGNKWGDPCVLKFFPLAFFLA